MIKILIVGCSSSVGGIETFFFQLLKNRPEGLYISFLCQDKLCAFSDEYLKNGYKLYHIPSRKSNPFLFAYRVEKFFLQNNDFDYIWINTCSTSQYEFQYYGKKYTNAKIITHSHGIGFEKTQTGCLGYLANAILSKLNRKKVIENTDLFFCCSEKAGIALFGNENKNKLIYINNGIDTEKFQFKEYLREEIRKSLNLSNDTMLLGLIGRLASVKNPIRAINIFEDYQKINNDSKLLIVGNGPMETSIKLEVNKRKIADKVIFIHHSNEVNKLMCAMDCLLLTSLSEGLPLVTVEAQCNGLPVVASDILPKEVLITNLVKCIDLNKPNYIWAKEINSLLSKKNTNVNRQKYAEIIRISDFNYLNSFKKIKNYLIS